MVSGAGIAAGVRAAHAAEVAASEAARQAARQAVRARVLASIGESEAARDWSRFGEHLRRLAVRERVEAAVTANRAVVRTSNFQVSGSRTTGASIGRSNYASIHEFADAVTVMYQQLYDQGHAVVMRLVKGGLVKNDPLVIGGQVDLFARQRLRHWLKNAEGIQEGRGQIIAVNRRLYDPAGSGLYRQPDVYIPGANLILDGSLELKVAMSPQILGFRAYSGGANVTIIRPAGLNIGPKGVGSYSLIF